MGIRLERLAHTLQEEISNLLREELDPNTYGWVSVTGVKLSKDLKDAVVFVTVFPEHLEGKALEKLQKMSGYIRKHLAGRVRAKTVPKVRFEIDNLTKLVERGVIEPPKGGG